MNWTDIAAIVFACVTINHLGLIAAVERIIKHSLPILNCPKCLTFWSVLAYGLVCFIMDLSGDGSAANPSYLARLLAISILSSYIAIWLELFEGFIDVIYQKTYEQIYSTTDTADTDKKRS